MLEKEAIHVVAPGELHQGFVSSIFLVPKKGGGQRPLVNLRHLNQFITYEHFKMEGIHMLKDLLRKRRDRPEGCLFHSASLAEPPKVSEVCLERNNVRVCLPALRAGKCFQSLHQTYETCRSPVTTTGYQTDSLFRRHAYHRSIPGHCPPSCLNRSRSFARVRLRDKLWTQS